MMSLDDLSAAAAARDAPPPPAAAAASAAPAPAPAEAAVPPAPTPVRVGNGVKVPLLIMATIATLAALDYGESVAMPVVLAFIISLTLTPINTWLQRRMPAAASAALLVTVLTLCVVVAAATLSQPVLDWISQAPRIGRAISEKLDEVRAPLARLTRLGDEVAKITTPAEDPTVQEVVIRQPGLMNLAASNLSLIVSTVVIAVAMTYFLLATNRLIYEKIVFMAPRLSDKKRALTTLNSIVSSVATYLLTITTINIAFGIVVAISMWAIGMPDPILWGIAAFFLKYLPIVGLVLGTVAGSVVGLLVYDTLVWALVPGLIYLGLSSLEGNFITPHIVGSRLELNPVAILFSITLWGFLWGVIGVVLAVPILIVLKVMCDNVPSLSAIGQFLSGATALEQEREEPVATLKTLP